MIYLADQLQVFTTIFLGIFIEAVPFLLLGTTISGLVEIFVSRDFVERRMPPGKILGAFAGVLLGFIFPVCECGVIPMTRRLMKKGLPPSATIAFLLSAPIVNPVVFASTYAAYGWGNIFVARFIMGLSVAILVGVIFSMNKSPSSIFRGLSPDMANTEDALLAIGVDQEGSVRPKIQAALRIAANEFFEMGMLLIAGSMLAALMQTLVPQKTLLSIASGPLFSVLTMEGIAFILSVCSTVDAFISLAFVNSFPSGAILAFLVLGPMIDVKSTIMLARIFSKKTLVYLIILPFLLVTLMSVFISLNLNW